jgi:hypothetical protein
MTYPKQKHHPWTQQAAANDNACRACAVEAGGYGTTEQHTCEHGRLRVAAERAEWLESLIAALTSVGLEADKARAVIALLEPHLKRHA